MALVDSMMLCVQLAGGFGVVGGLQVVPMGGVGMMRRGFDVFGLVMFGRLAVMVGGFFVMVGRFFVMVSDLIRMRHRARSRVNADDMSAIERYRWPVTGPLKWDDCCMTCRNAASGGGDTDRIHLSLTNICADLSTVCPLLLDRADGSGRTRDMLFVASGLPHAG